MDPVITNNDIGSVILKDAVHRDEILRFAGADTFVDGTILARQEVETAITVTPDVGNTGDGTLTASVVGVDEIPLAGNYNFECTFAVANGGVFKLVDPNGNIVADNLTLRVGAGLVTTLNVEGLQLVVTDGAADFVAGDKFEVAVVADNDLIPFAIGGAAGAGKPSHVLTYDVTKAGAGNEFIRAMTSGQVRKERLIIDADGDGSNITDAILDELRSAGIEAVDVQELNILDNQP
jgi:hypothetical protein